VPGRTTTRDAGTGAPIVNVDERLHTDWPVASKISGRSAGNAGSQANGSGFSPPYRVKSVNDNDDTAPECSSRYWNGVSAAKPPGTPTK
jgi:hypothetical protein